MTEAVSPPTALEPSTADRISTFFYRHWLLILNLFFGLWVALPWFAPVFSAMGLTGLAGLIYKIYSVQCHQLPERSYFLFGPKTMYSVPEINTAWPYADFLRLRLFTGNADFGFKVAWSDRMVSFYTPYFLSGLWMAVSRWRRRKKTGNPEATSGWRAMPVWLWVLLLVPLGIDGISHTISDAINFGAGFRDTNAWLAALTNNALPATFYAGDAIGSFNWWMRLLTGLLAGFGTMRFILPMLEDMFGLETQRAAQKTGLEKAEIH